MQVKDKKEKRIMGERRKMQKRGLLGVNLS